MENNMTKTNPNGKLENTQQMKADGTDDLDVVQETGEHVEDECPECNLVENECECVDEDPNLAGGDIDDVPNDDPELAGGDIEEVCPDCNNMTKDCVCTNEDPNLAGGNIK